MSEELKSKNLISIIIPVYNVEKYLEKCLNSVINQTYKNLEIIVVDDGSTDRSGDICDNFAKEDPRIKVIHKKNGGLSDARNVGFKAATGNYIGFVDSDDWIELNMYELMMYNIKRYNTDAIICNFNEIMNNRAKNIDKTSDSLILEFSGKELLEEIITNNRGTGISYSVWKFLFKKEIVDGIKFEEGRYYEDLLFITLSSFKIKHSVYINQKLYNYVIHDKSISHSKITMKHVEDIVEQTLIQIDILEKKLSKEIIDIVKRNLYFLVISLYKEMMCNKDRDKEKEYLKKIWKSLKIKKWNLISKDMGYKTKLLIKLSMISPVLYVKLCELKIRISKKK